MKTRLLILSAFFALGVYGMQAASLQARRAQAKIAGSIGILKTLTGEQREKRIRALQKAFDSAPTEIQNKYRDKLIREGVSLSPGDLDKAKAQAEAAKALKNAEASAKKAKTAATEATNLVSTLTPGIDPHAAVTAYAKEASDQAEAAEKAVATARSKVNDAKTALSKESAEQSAGEAKTAEQAAETAAIAAEKALTDAKEAVQKAGMDEAARLKAAKAQADKAVTAAEAAAKRAQTAVTAAQGVYDGAGDKQDDVQTHLDSAKKHAGDADIAVTGAKNHKKTADEATDATAAETAATAAETAVTAAETAAIAAEKALTDARNAAQAGPPPPLKVVGTTVTAEDGSVFEVTNATALATNLETLAKLSDADLEKAGQALAETMPVGGKAIAAEINKVFDQLTVGDEIKVGSDAQKKALIAFYQKSVEKLDPTRRASIEDDLNGISIR